MKIKIKTNRYGKEVTRAAAFSGVRVISEKEDTFILEGSDEEIASFKKIIKDMVRGRKEYKRRVKECRNLANTALKELRHKFPTAEIHISEDGDKACVAVQVGSRLEKLQELILKVLNAEIDNKLFDLCDGGVLTRISKTVVPFSYGCLSEWDYKSRFFPDEPSGIPSTVDYQTTRAAERIILGIKIPVLWEYWNGEEIWRVDQFKRAIARLEAEEEKWSEFASKLADYLF